MALVTLWLIIFIITFIVWLALAGAVSRDAKARGRSQAWTVVVLIFGVFGLIAYALTIGGGSNNSGSRTTSQSTEIECPECGASNVGNPNFCQNCGDELPTTVDCPVCGASNDSQANFCQGCGGELSTSNQGKTSVENNVVEIDGSDTGMMSMTCPNCGARNSKNAPKCMGCKSEFVRK